jgi:hypothetical protein
MNNTRTTIDRFYIGIAIAGGVVLTLIMLALLFAKGS